MASLFNLSLPEDANNVWNTSIAATQQVKTAHSFVTFWDDNDAVCFVDNDIYSRQEICERTSVRNHEGDEVGVHIAQSWSSLPCCTWLGWLLQASGIRISFWLHWLICIPVSNSCWQAFRREAVVLEPFPYLLGIPFAKCSVTDSNIKSWVLQVRQKWGRCKVTLFNASVIFLLVLLRFQLPF